MESFGIIGAFLHAGVVNKLVFVFLIILSVYSWSLIFKKFFEFKKELKAFDDFRKAVLSKDANIVESFVYSRDNQYSNLLEDMSNVEITAKTNLDHIKTTTKGYLIDSNAKLAFRLDHLATISNAAPFIGLFGTVMGVINSFYKIGAETSAALSVIAPGIAEALYATAIGLFVAVPAGVFYNAFTTKIDNLELSQEMIIEQLFEIIRKSSSKKKS